MVLIYQYCVGAVAVDGVRAKNYYSRADATYQIFQQVEEMENSSILPENLYISIKEATSMRRTYTYQFLLYDYKIIWELPPQEADEAIVLSDKEKDAELFEAGYLCSKLDKNEYIYVKGEKLISLFEGAGCSFYASEE